jgi:hypothetical protein
LTIGDLIKFFKTVIWIKTHPGKFRQDHRWNLVSTKNGPEKYLINRKDIKLKLEIMVEKFIENPHKVVVKFLLKNI